MNLVCERRKPDVPGVYPVLSQGSPGRITRPLLPRYGSWESPGRQFCTAIELHCYVEEGRASFYSCYKPTDRYTSLLIFRKALVEAIDRYEEVVPNADMNIISYHSNGTRSSRYDEFRSPKRICFSQPTEFDHVQGVIRVEDSSSSVVMLVWRGLDPG